MGCHGPEGHDGKEPRHEKKERLTTSSGGDHDRHLAEKLRVEASPKNSSYKIPVGDFTSSGESESSPEGVTLSGRVEDQGETLWSGSDPEDETDQW